MSPMAFAKLVLRPSNSEESEALTGGLIVKSALKSALPLISVISNTLSELVCVFFTIKSKYAT